MTRKRRLTISLGALFWLMTTLMLAGALHAAYARVARDVVYLHLEVTGDHALKRGDGVYLARDEGFLPIGEVRSVTRDRSGDRSRIRLALRADALDELTAESSAVCWRTPLSAEQVLPMLLPPAIRFRMGEQIAADWTDHQDKLAEAWGPLAAELTAEYVRLVRDDLELALRRYDDDLWKIMQAHVREAAKSWPAIQHRLGPILEEHLTPVLGRLMNDAISEAPKVTIAWLIARGRNAEAYKEMLDWLSVYLATMPDKDKAELEAAFRRTWNEARNDPELAAYASDIGQAVIEDKALREVLGKIYHEAVADNPHTAEFFQQKIFASPRVRERMYEFIEAFAPTARVVLQLFLLDDSGRTRPEMVHFIRSAALRRKVSWVTLDPGPITADPLDPSVTIRATTAGANP